MPSRRPQLMHITVGVNRINRLACKVGLQTAQRILPSCNGLQWKWLRTAINGNLGPDYLHLSIPSGQDYLPLRLLLSSWDCNQRPWDHITCDSPEPPSSACLYAR